MNLSREDFAALVAEANLAPSVHNTQPTRLRLEPDGRVLVLEAMERRLRVGDPEGRDADVSHGAAIEGFALACAARGVAVVVEALAGAAEPPLRPVARLTLTPNGAAPDPLHAGVASRRTYRGAFLKGRPPAAALDVLTQAADAHLARGADAIAHLAALNDEAGLRTFRNAAFRAELVSWMRLSRRDPNWALDGLNAEAMEMSPFVAAGAGFVLKPGVFEAFDRFGAAATVVSDAHVVRSSAAIALFHRPQGEPPLETGRFFYRYWLGVTAQGLSLAPMAVLADDVAARARIAKDFNLPADRRLITGFRIGAAPTRALGPKPRLPTAQLVV